MSTPLPRVIIAAVVLTITLNSLQGCKPKTAQSAAGGDAQRSFVAPGKYDEFYNVVSGGFNGQIGIYGIPSGRVIGIVTVLYPKPENR